MHDVVVCIHNGHKDVDDCLLSLTKNWNSDLLQRLILVDDQSDKEMEKMLSSYGERFSYVTVIRTEERSFYTKAANLGLKSSTAKYRTLLNSDTIVTNGWEERIQAVFATSEYVGVVGPLSNAASTQSVPFVKSTKDQTAINSLPEGVSVEEFGSFVREVGASVPTPFVPLVHGFCLTVRDSLLAEIGYFDELSFPRGYGEENDFCFRAEDAGFLLAVAVDVFIFHAKSKSYTSSDRTNFMHAGMKAFAAKHGSERIKRSIRYMEAQPHLQFMRDAVANKWPDHYQVSA